MGKAVRQRGYCKIAKADASAGKVQAIRPGLKVQDMVMIMCSGGTEHKDIVAIATDQQVMPGAPFKPVVAPTALKQIMSGAALERVVTAPAAQLIAARTA